MKATLYKELSNKQTPLELQAGLTVQEALPCFDLDNAIIVINGRIENYNYILQEKDKVTIRLTPNGTTALLVVAIVSAVLAVGAGVVGGVLAYNARVEAEKAKAELEKMKKLSNKPDIDNRPFLRGASNTLATGNNQPYIIGRHFFTPYLLCSPFYELAGTDGVDQYIYTVLECGFNKQVLKKIAIDDIVIKTFTDTTPQEGGYNLDSGIFTEGGSIEIAQDGELLSEIPALNYKVDSKTCNDQIPHDSEVAEGTKEYLTYTLNPYAKDVDIAITFPYGLFAVDDNGDKIETQVAITPQYSLDGGSSWVDFTFNNNGTQTNLFKRVISTKELRYTAHKDFTASDYNTLKTNNQSAIYIRVRSNGNKDSRIKNECYCLFYQSVCFDPDKSTDRELVPCKVIEDRERAFCTILGLKLKASKINEEKLKKINVITQGIARTWNGTKWSEEKTETRNPAAWALEIETSDSHPASQYEDSELDLESFGEFYEYCEDKGFKFDWVITQNTKKDATLNHIMEATGACIYTDIYGRRAIAIDKPQENALAVYNPQNIISIQNKKTFGRRTDGLRIKYVNSKDDLYQEDTYLLMREVNGEPLELTPDSIIKDVNITGITTFEHIVKYARRLMAIEALRPKTTIIEVGNEGVFYTPYSKILIQDDSLKIGIGNGYTIKATKWEDGLLKKIYTNEPLMLETTETYGIIVNCFTKKGVMPVKIKVVGDGYTTKLTVLTNIHASAYAAPDIGNVFSFGEIDADGEFSKVSTPYIISQIKRSDKGFSLELVNYHEAIYESGRIPDYKSNITQRRLTIPKSIPPNINGKDGKDGTTKFLSSLEVQGDYENQIGTYQGQLYRWVNNKWELLNAVMPVNPICCYDFADVQYKDVTPDDLKDFSHTFPAGISYSEYSTATIKKLKNGNKYRITADFEVIQGNTLQATMYYYDFDAGGQWGGSLATSHTPVVNGRCSCSLDFTCRNTDLQGHRLKILFYNGRAGNIAPNAISKWSNFRIETISDTQAIDSSGYKNHSKIVGDVEKSKDDKIGAVLKFNKGGLTRPPKDFIGVGKQWSHSRWLKIDEAQQDPNTNPRLWRYGSFDYALFDIVSNNGVATNVGVLSYKNAANENSFSISKTKLLNNNWHNLIVCNDIQANYARKKIYLDGTKIYDKTNSGDFSNWANSEPHNDMKVWTTYSAGEMSNLLFFDRLLTDQEALWLYLNPQYPVKNYSLADWSISPDNPDNVLASATPKYLGVVETVPSTRTAVITKGERLGAVDANPGDWVLSGKTIGGWKVGVCYKWSGLAWKPLEPAINYAKEYHACLVHLFEIEELKQQTGHFGALFAKVLVAQKAMIDELLVNQAFIKNLVVRKLRIDTIEGDEHNDFEAWFDELNGLKIRNKGEEIFKVDTTGNVFAKNAFLQDGTFTGDIYSGPLELSTREPFSKTYFFKKNTRIDLYFNEHGALHCFGEGFYKNQRIIEIILTYHSLSWYRSWELIGFDPSRKPILKGEYQLRQNENNEDIVWFDERLIEDVKFKTNAYTKTFKLKDLPRSMPDEKDVLWVENGILKITE